MRTALLLALVLPACGGADEHVPPAAPDAEPDPDAPPALTLRATGTASGTSGNDAVDCSFAIDLIDLVETADGWSGVATGEVFRRPMPDGGMFEFSALVGGPATITRTGATIEARLVGDQPDDAAAFWLALEVLTATETGELTFEGTWTCSPILLGDPGFTDVDIDAAGTWTLGPS